MGAAAINNKKELLGMFKIYNFIEIMLKHAYIIHNNDILARICVHCKRQEPGWKIKRL